MKASILSLFAATALAAPGNQRRNANDPPQQVTIEKTGYSGNGCPQGTVSTLLSDDHTVVTFGFDSFQAAIGPSVSAANKQKNCQIHLGLRYPSGYQLSVLQATYHGYVRLDAGVNANFISSYYFSQDASRTAGSRTYIAGPEYQNGKSYTKTDNVENSATVWSPCGANGILNVNNRIALTSQNANGTGEISNDDATFKFQQKLRIVWRSCGAGDAGPAYRPTAFPDPAPQPQPQYEGDSGNYGYPTYPSYPSGTYTETTSPNGGSYVSGPQGQGFPPFGGYGGGYPGGYQVYGPGGVPIGGSSGISSSFTRPVDTTVQES